MHFLLRPKCFPLTSSPDSSGPGDHPVLTQQKLGLAIPGETDLRGTREKHVQEDGEQQATRATDCPEQRGGGGWADQPSPRQGCRTRGCRKVVTNMMSSRATSAQRCPHSLPSQGAPTLLRCCTAAARPGPPPAGVPSHPDSTPLMTISQHHTRGHHTGSQRTRKLGRPQTQKLSGGS